MTASTSVPFSLPLHLFPLVTVLHERIVASNVSDSSLVPCFLQVDILGRFLNISLNTDVVVAA